MSRVTLPGCCCTCWVKAARAAAGSSLSIRANSSAMARGSRSALRIRDSIASRYWRPATSMSLRAIGKRVQVLGTRAGLGKVSPHMLRRSFATSLLSAGNDLSVTADLMGHARTDTTRLYDRRGESAKRAAASTISVPYVRPGAQRASELELGDPPGAVE